MIDLIGETVQRRRKALRITQRDLAVLAGCSEPFVVALENGKETVRLDKVLDVLKVLGLQICIQPGKEGLIVDSTL